MNVDVDPGVKIDFYDNDYNPITTNKLPYGTSLRAKVTFDNPNSLFSILVSHHDFDMIYRTLDIDDYFPIEALCQPEYTVKIKLYDESDLTEKHIHVENAGSLETLLTPEDSQIGYLSLSGNLNFDDILSINQQLPLLISLDMGQSSFDGEFPGLNSRRFLRHVVLPSNMNSIGQNAFSDTSIEEIVIPEGVETLGFGAFVRCSKLNDISLPSSLKVIGPHCFHGCTSLTGIKMALEGNVLEIGDFAFNGCSKLELLNVGNSLTCIGDRSFEECTSLKSINLPSTLVSIGERAFYNNVSLQKIEIPYSVESIGTYAFYNCESASELILNDNLTQIPEGAFMLCNGYKTLRIGKNVKDIGVSAFFGDYTDLYLNSNLKHVSSFGLSSNSLENVYIPSTTALEVEEDAITCCNLYIPGNTSNLLSCIPHKNLIEMWTFEIDRKNHLLSVKPEIEELAITDVIINGQKTTPIEDCCYPLASEDTPDVVVNYTLHNREAMTTHYDAEFMASMPDTDLSEVFEILLDSDAKADLYNSNGILLKRDCTQEDVKQLAPGLYIIAGKKVIVK